jgi:hypothetical protein
VTTDAGKNPKRDASSDFAFVKPLDFRYIYMVDSEYEEQKEHTSSKLG